MLQVRYRTGSDGKTPHEKIRGRKCKEPIVPFGELVWYKQLKESHEQRGKLETTWQEGIWLGQRNKSNEVLIGTKDGVVKSWAESAEGGSEVGEHGATPAPAPAPRQPALQAHQQTRGKRCGWAKQPQRGGHAECGSSAR